MSTTDELWGGQLKAVTFDPVSHRLALQVDVLESGVTTAYDLTCNGVSALRFDNSIPLPWTYAEVTEVHASRTTSGDWVLELTLWSEDAELICTCKEFSVEARSV
jgi:hypothetical protein